MKRHWLFLGALCAASTFAFLATGKHHYGFYTATRWVVFGVCAWTVWDSRKIFWKSLGPLFVIVGVVFNPFAPLHFTRDTWHTWDLVAGCLTGISAGIVLLRLVTEKLASERERADEIANESSGPVRLTIAPEPLHDAENSPSPDHLIKAAGDGADGYAQDVPPLGQTDSLEFTSTIRLSLPEVVRFVMDLDAPLEDTLQEALRWNVEHYGIAAIKQRVEDLDESAADADEDKHAAAYIAALALTTDQMPHLGNGVLTSILVSWMLDESTAASVYKYQLERAFRDGGSLHIRRDSFLKAALRLLTDYGKNYFDRTHFPENDHLEDVIYRESFESSWNDFKASEMQQYFRQPVQGGLA